MTPATIARQVMKPVLYFAWVLALAYATGALSC
jgi:hypothetical protein